MSKINYMKKIMNELVFFMREFRESKDISNELKPPLPLLKTSYKLQLKKCIPT